MAKRISEEQFQQEVLESALPVVVDFYSDSCIPCKQLSPLLGAVEDDYAGKLSVVKINVNYDAALAERYSVMAAPTLLFFRDGREQERTRGLMKKTELLEHVEKLLQAE